MAPLFHAGQTISCLRIPAPLIHPGDIVCFYHPRLKSLIVHRLISLDLKNRSYVTRGDANPYPDKFNNRFENYLGVCSLHLTLPTRFKILHYRLNTFLSKLLPFN